MENWSVQRPIFQIHKNPESDATNSASAFPFVTPTLSKKMVLESCWKPNVSWRRQLVFNCGNTVMLFFLRLDDPSTDLDLEHKTTNIFLMEFLLQRNYTLWSKRMFSDILTVWWRPKRLRCMSRDSTFDPFQRRNQKTCLDRKISRFRNFFDVTPKIRVHLNRIVSIREDLHLSWSRRNQKISQRKKMDGAAIAGYSVGIHRSYTCMSS